MNTTGREAFTLVLAAVAVAALSAACTVGPPYVRPAVETPPPGFKEATPAASGVAWTAAAPADSALKGEWWTHFQDTALNDLETRVDISSQTIKQAAAQFQLARAI